MASKIPSGVLIQKLEMEQNALDAPGPPGILSKKMFKNQINIVQPSPESAISTPRVQGKVFIGVVSHPTGFRVGPSFKILLSPHEFAT